jgi:hypothetical protein
MPIRARPILLTLLVAASAFASACGTLDIASAPAVPTPKDCSEPAKLFDWFSIRVNTVSWAKGADPKDAGTLTIVFTIVNTDPLPRALSNLGKGFLYVLEYSLKADDGTVYAATDPSGIVAGNEVHSEIEYHKSKEGTLKFKVPKGNYAVIFGRKYDGKLIAKYDFSCTLTVQ